MKAWFNAALIVVMACATRAPSAELAQQPAAVQVAPRAGATLESALASLNAQGFRIVYSSALVSPAMTVRAQPKATQIDLLLTEILAPWHLHAVRAANGDWLIVGDANRDAPADPPAAASGVDEAVESIDTIDVTASRMRLATPGSSEVFLDRAAVERLPHLADDAVRMLKVMPGVSGGDFTAALNVRGGRREETALLIDGAEIHNGFHFRDIDGALSVLDTNLVQGIDFITGGMTAEHGDYMSGIVDMASKQPSPDDDYRSGVGVSFVSVYAHSSGFFAHDRGSWLLSVRRGFLDLLTAQMMGEGEQLTPRYSDLFGSLNLAIGDNSSLAVRLLLSDDDLKFVASSSDDDVDSAGKGQSAHGWATFEHDWAPDVHSTTMLSASTMHQVRDSDGRERRRSGTVDSDSDFRFFDLRQDLAWRLGDANLVRAGINLGRQDGSYDYALVGSIYDPLVTPQPIDINYSTLMDVRMQKVGAFVSWRTRLSESLTGEAGVRWDQYRYQPGESYDVFSPRLNMVYSFGSDSELRAAWSVMHQAQGANELQVEDNVTVFFEPEQSQQLVLGYARHFDMGLSLRVDLYDKRYSHLRTRYENALDPLQLIPEGAIDRITIVAPEARAQGIELTLRRAATRGFAGWASVAFARAEDKDQGYWTPRSWEQQLTLSLGSSWTSDKWNLSLTGLFHSGTPTTSLSLDGVGPRNGDRLSPYARVDLRASRDVQLERSELSFYLEVTNLLNMKNECCIDDFKLAEDDNGNPVLDVERSYGFPILPSFGFRWEF